MALAALLFSSCGEDFLDKEPKNTVDPETNVTDDVAVALANACYRTLQSSNMYNQRIWTLDIVAGNSIVVQVVAPTDLRPFKPPTSSLRATTAWPSTCGVLPGWASDNATS